ncbi:sulfurtransferase TusA family protein [Archaeoglobus veneficus]|uniref:sulfurtransferase TusA family protein n=1 Tax=Archaeoglobus veneficus TaxID=58290 RepID=UPI0006943E87|nr:sulfurtransferase TusA family protein [Archaeoglobus veneficus]
MAEEEMDLRGLKCPQPILKIHARVTKLPPGTTIKVMADCPTFERDLKIWAAKTGKTILECVKTGNIWRARIRI